MAIMVHCVAFGCSNGEKATKERGVSFHRFPRNDETRRKWVVALKLKKLPPHYDRTGYVCSEHFREEDYQRDLQAELLGTKKRRVLKEGSVPSVFVFRSAKHRKAPSKARECARVSTSTSRPIRACG